MGACNGSNIATATVSPMPNNMSTNNVSARERTRAKQFAEVCLDHSSTDAYPAAKNSMPPKVMLIKSSCTFFTAQQNLLAYIMLFQLKQVLCFICFLSNLQLVPFLCAFSFTSPMIPTPVLTCLEASYFHLRQLSPRTTYPTADTHFILKKKIFISIPVLLYLLYAN